MALALARLCAPLQVTDIVEAADQLSASATTAHVIAHLLSRGADLMQARTTVEALIVLRDVCSMT